MMSRASFNYKTVSGIGSIVLENCVETKFKRLMLFGNSAQGENPSIESPKEIKNSGKYDEVSGKYVIDVSVTGKNLFDISKNKYKCDEEKICIPSKALAEINITEGIIFEEKTAYFLSWESYIITKPNSDWSPIFGVEYTDKTREEFYMLLSKNGAKTNANKTIKYVYIRNPWSVGIDISRIQIEKGNERTEYEPYHEPQTVKIQLNEPLRGIGEYKDVITKDGIVRNILQVRIADYLQKAIYGKPGGRYIFSAVPNCYINYDRKRCMSNVGFTTNQENIAYMLVPYLDNFKLVVSDDDTVETIREKVKDMVVAYTVKEPILEPFENSLESLHTNDGTTIITVDSGEVETGIEVEYAIKN